VYELEYALKEEVYGYLGDYSHPLAITSFDIYVYYLRDINKAGEDREDREESCEGERRRLFLI
jgi:hypothetical protein